MSSVSEEIEDPSADPVEESAESADHQKPAAATVIAAPARLHSSERKYHVTILGLCTLVIALSMVLSCHDDDRRVLLPVIGAPLPELCLSKRMGFECPGCGMTRSFISIAHLEFARAFRFNPGGVLLFAIVAFQIPFRSYQLWRMSRGRRPISHWLLTLPLYACIVVVIGQWVVKVAERISSGA